MATYSKPVLFRDFLSEEYRQAPVAAVSDTDRGNFCDLQPVTFVWSQSSSLTVLLQRPRKDREAKHFDFLGEIDPSKNKHLFRSINAAGTSLSDDLVAEGQHLLLPPTTLYGLLNIQHALLRDRQRGPQAQPKVINVAAHQHGHVVDVGLPGGGVTLSSLSRASLDIRDIVERGNIGSTRPTCYSCTMKWDETDPEKVNFVIPTPSRAGVSSQEWADAFLVTYLGTMLSAVQHAPEAISQGWKFMSITLVPLREDDTFASKVSPGIANSLLLECPMRRMFSTTGRIPQESEMQEINHLSAIAVIELMLRQCPQKRWVVKLPYNCIEVAKVLPYALQFVDLRGLTAEEFSKSDVFEEILASKNPAHKFAETNPRVSYAVITKWLYARLLWEHDPRPLTADIANDKWKGATANYADTVTKIPWNIPLIDTRIMHAFIGFVVYGQGGNSTSQHSTPKTPQSGGFRKYENFFETEVIVPAGAEELSFDFRGWFGEATNNARLTVTGWRS